jgi:hypothetical protein
VTLVSASRNVQAGLRFGLAHWRASDWQWERYGQLTAVKNADLWQRLDRLLDIHHVECRATRGKAADDLAAPPPRWRQLGDGRRVRFDGAGAAKSEEPKNRRTKETQTTKWSSGRLLSEIGSSVRRLFGF